jgi:L-malate glycosyltransferase
MQTKTILHITTWYPNSLDEQLGVFVQKHIEKGYTFSKNIVLAIIPCTTDKVKNIELAHTIENSVDVIRVYYPENKLHKFLSLSIRNKAIRLGVKKVERLNNEIDLIQCHIAEVSLWIAFKFYSNKPVFLIEHWSGFIDGRFEKIPSVVRRAIVKRMNNCQHIFVVSEHLKKSIIEKGISVPISIIPNVIEHKSVKKEVTIPFTFGVVADLVDEVKNISGIIKAFSQFKKELKDNSTRLVVIGDGVDKVKLEKLVDTLALKNEVAFKGRLKNDEVLSILPTFDILIVNSYNETYSMITAEALLSGVAVISTKCGGPEQFIMHSINGYLIEVNDEKGLCQAMKHSIENESFKKYDVISREISLKVDVTKLSSLIIDKINF